MSTLRYIVLHNLMWTSVTPKKILTSNCVWEFHCRLTSEKSPLNSFKLCTCKSSHHCQMMKLISHLLTCLVGSHSKDEHVMPLQSQLYYAWIHTRLVTTVLSLGIVCCACIDCSPCNSSIVHGIKLLRLTSRATVHEEWIYLDLEEYSLWEMLLHLHKLYTCPNTHHTAFSWWEYMYFTYTVPCDRWACSVGI